jgi:L-amino acid N-acyltransferase YncA
MAYLHCRIETQPGRAQAWTEPVETWRSKHAMREPTPDRLVAEAEAHGYEIHPPFGPFTMATWPLTLVAYVSKAADGMGRSSNLYSWPARKR